MIQQGDMNLGEKRLQTKYKIECFENWYRDPIFKLKLWKRKIPKLKWADSFENLVVTAGLNKVLDATFKTGLASPAWYVGLKGTGTPLAADTMASHASWSELTPYSNSNRPTFTPGTISAGSVDNSAAKAVFNINATSTVVGAFLADDNTKGGATGTLYGVGDFAASRSVASGDTLNLTVTLTQS